jgi:hypothetical protein
MTRALCLTLLAAACAATPRAPAPPLPRPLDYEKLAPPAPPPVEVSADLPRFPDIPIDEGDCLERPAGILVSEGVYADLQEARIDRGRQAAAAKTCREVRRAESAEFQAAEAAYLARVAEFDRQLARERRLGTLKLWGGFAGGVALFLVSTWAVGKLGR